jgi:hypothetical protein
VETVAHERRPGFVAACVAAACANLAAWWLFGLIALPLALATSTAVAFSADRPADAFRIILPWLLLVAAQPFVAAWIAQSGLAFFDAGRVTYARACGAMLLGLVVTIGAAFTLPAEAAVPVVGDAWTGALAAAFVLAGGRDGAR